MTANELPWHEEVLSSLLSAQQQGRLPHALGLTAPTGWGITGLAERLARDLLDIPVSQPISEVAHPDLRWVEPDGAMLKIDQIRAVRDYAVQTPQIASLKVIVLIHADLLNIESANALLKTLEEPPPNTLLVLCTENWGRLLPTVRSRCQRVELRCSQAVALAWLEDQGISVDHDTFADAGYAPLTAVAQADFRLDRWLDRVATQGPTAVDMNDLPDDLAGWLAAWYRAIIRRVAGQMAEQGGAQAAARLIEFTGEILSVRRQLMTRNFQTGPLLVERLAFLWHRLNREIAV